MSNLLHYIHGSNAGYVLELYEQYLRDPASVDGRTRALFEMAPPILDEPPTPAKPMNQKAPIKPPPTTNSTKPWPWPIWPKPSANTAI